MSDIAVAALLAGSVLVASMISVEVGLSVALIELFAGVVVGNVFHLDVPSWLAFLGTFAGLLLTFQAGAEVDVPQFRREWKASVSIGLVSFLAPFALVGLLTYYVLGWNHRQAEIGGLALSTTSLAVVYAVLVETGLNRELVGKRLMSATFVTDIATVAGLTILFVKPTRSAAETSTNGAIQNVGFANSTVSPVTVAMSVTKVADMSRFPTSSRLSPVSTSTA